MEDKSIVYRINRFFYAIFNPKVNMWIVCLNVMLIFWFIIFGDRDSVVEDIISLLFVDVLIMLYFIFHTPKTVKTNGRDIEFYEYIHMAPKTITFVTTKNRFFWLKVNYSVSNIGDVKFHQSFIEKIFDVGRISFAGTPVITAERDVDRIEKNDRYIIYGIKHFSNVKSQFSYN